MLYEFEGYSGELEIYEDRIIITHNGSVAKVSKFINAKNDVIILFSDIKYIDFKFGNYIKNGYITFFLNDEQEYVSTLVNAAVSEYAVIFTVKQNNNARYIIDKIENLVNENSPIKRNIRLKANAENKVNTKYTYTAVNTTNKSITYNYI